MDQHTDDLMQRQMDLEADMVDQGVHRYLSNFHKALSKDRFGETYPGTILTKMAIEPMADAIREWVAEALSGKRGRRNRSAVNIKEMDPRSVAFIAVRTIFSKLYKRNGLASVGTTVGKAVADEARFLEFEEKAPALFRKVDEQAKKNGADPERRRSTLIYAMNKFDIPFKVWTPNEKLQLGVKLVELFAEVSGFITIHRDPTIEGEGFMHRVLPTETLLSFVEKRNDIASLIRPSFMPMVVQPNRWEKYRGSPYKTGQIASSPLRLIKNRSDNSVKFPDEQVMPVVYRGVNAIQETPWRINRKVLDVLSHLWEHNLDTPGIPRKENRKVRPYPEGCTKEESILWRKEAREIHDANAKSQGTRLQVVMALQMAERFRDDAAFYFPHYLDFRGRTYPLATGLSPQGADYNRAMLEFARGKPLGDFEAVRWLAIHGANVYGEDKIALEDRVQWVFDHEDEILWCAEDPFKFDWWHQADKPFSFLAFCYEWEGYKKRGLEHVTRLPIALDGTCNGLQHFSAMLRDSVGGASVNLLPSDEPQDIYGDVAEEVKRALAGPQADDKRKLWADTWLAFGIDRKITKRPVMVMPYGGTFRSCSKYVAEEVNERIAESGHDPFGTDLKPAITFLSQIVWNSLGKVVVAAKVAMGWLQKLARLTTKYDLTLQWTTPTGFVVRQKYMSQELRRVKTKLYGSLTYLSFKENTDEIAVSKQSSAMSPNFVHSLDSAAMMLTIDAALEEGITDFAMIHDSYGTLATDTAKLSRLIREAFVRMYREHDVLEDLRNDILAILPEEAHDDVPPVPPKGALILDDVLKSDFFFS